MSRSIRIWADDDEESHLEVVLGPPLYLSLVLVVDPLLLILRQSLVALATHQQHPHFRQLLAGSHVASLL